MQINKINSQTFSAKCYVDVNTAKKMLPKYNENLSLGLLNALNKINNDDWSTLLHFSFGKNKNNKDVIDLACIYSPKTKSSMNFASLDPENLQKNPAWKIKKIIFGIYKNLKKADVDEYYRNKITNTFPEIKDGNYPGTEKKKKIISKLNKNTIEEICQKYNSLAILK